MKVLAIGHTWSNILLLYIFLIKHVFHQLRCTGFSHHFAFAPVKVIQALIQLHREQLSCQALKLNLVPKQWWIRNSTTSKIVFYKKKLWLCLIHYNLIDERMSATGRWCQLLMNPPSWGRPHTAPRGGSEPASWRWKRRRTWRRAWRWRWKRTWRWRWKQRCSVATDWCSAPADGFIYPAVIASVLLLVDWFPVQYDMK